MSPAEHEPWSEPVRPVELLRELDLLASVEHALVVEYLSVHCALGHDLSADEGGPTTTPGSEAASAASALAQGQMTRLRDVNRFLVAAGSPAQMVRAMSVTGTAAGAAISLDPPTAAQLATMLEREERIATAVDERYARLVAAVGSTPAVEGDLRDALRPLVEDGRTHRTALAPFRKALTGVDVATLLRATRREPADVFEQRLQGGSDRWYQMVVTALQEEFSQPDFSVSGTFRQLALSAMFGLDEANRVLVQRGLLPPFS